MNNFIRSASANPISSILKMKIFRIKRKRYSLAGLRSFSSSSNFSHLKRCEYFYYFSEVFVTNLTFGDIY